jgi:hypothetical protein
VPSEIHTTDYVDVEQRATELGCRVPTEFAILPRYFATASDKDALVQEDTAPTVRILLRAAGIPETPIESEGERFPLIEENSFEWVGPTIFIGAAIFSANSHMISVALSVIANYLTDYFKGRPGEKKAKLRIVVPQPRTKKYTEITYEGDIEGLPGLQKIIKEVRNGRATE